MHLQQAGAPAPAPTPMSRQALVLADLARLGRRMLDSEGTLAPAPCCCIMAAPIQALDVALASTLRAPSESQLMPLTHANGTQLSSG